MEDQQNKEGRKLFDGKNEKWVLSKLRGAWDWGATDEEACVHANISVSALHRYFESHPEFREERDNRKLKPILKARKTIYDDLGNVKTAKWFLERKLRDEFPRSDQGAKPPSIFDSPTLADAIKAAEAITAKHEHRERH